MHTAEHGIATLAAEDVLLKNSRIAPRRQARPPRTESNVATTALQSAEFALRFLDGDCLFLVFPSASIRATELMERLQELASLPAGWNSYNAKPVSSKSVHRLATTLFDIVLRDDLPTGAIVPTSAGGLQIEWHRRGADVEINVPPAGPIEYLIVDPTAGIDLETTDAVDEDLVVGALQRMVAPAH
jgi:hypothetical protein